jgi:chromosomal replication initiator protein
LTLKVSDCRRAVQVRYRLTRDEIVGPCRKRKFSYPRQIAMMLAREMTPMSTTFIGRRFNRDHTTVVHAQRMMAALEEADPVLHMEITQLRLTLATYAAQQVVGAWE